MEVLLDTNVFLELFPDQKHAYRYTTARRMGLSLVSVDSDFDRTDLPRLGPSRI